MTNVFLRAENSDFVLGINKTNTQGLPPISQGEFNSLVIEYTIYYLILGIAMFVTSYVQIACWEVLAERVVYNLRQNYLKSMLRQEVIWICSLRFREIVILTKVRNCFIFEYYRILSKMDNQIEVMFQA